MGQLRGANRHPGKEAIFIGGSRVEPRTLSIRRALCTPPPDLGSKQVSDFPCKYFLLERFSQNSPLRTSLSSPLVLRLCKCSNLINFVTVGLSRDPSTTKCKVSMKWNKQRFNFYLTLDFRRTRNMILEFHLSCYFDSLLSVLSILL